MKTKKKRDPVARALALTTPCKDCPFRNDIRAYLSKDRVRGLEQDLAYRGNNFSCHKTVDYSHDDGGRTENSCNCAGAMILLTKIGRTTPSMQFAERMGLFDFSKLDLDAPVFDTFQEMIDAQHD